MISPEVNFQCPGEILINGVFFNFKFDQGDCGESEVVPRENN